MQIGQQCPRLTWITLIRMDLLFVNRKDNIIKQDSRDRDEEHVA
jgi:hypothetical protein